MAYFCAQQQWFKTNRMWLSFVRSGVGLKRYFFGFPLCARTMV
jgi:hypothetical protein